MDFAAWLRSLPYRHKVLMLGSMGLCRISFESLCLENLSKFDPCLIHWMWCCMIQSLKLFGAAGLRRMFVSCSLLMCPFHSFAKNTSEAFQNATRSEIWLAAWTNVNTSPEISWDHAMNAFKKSKDCWKPWTHLRPKLWWGSSSWAFNTVYWQYTFINL